MSDFESDSDLDLSSDDDSVNISSSEDENSKKRKISKAPKKATPTKKSKEPSKVSKVIEAKPKLNLTADTVKPVAKSTTVTAEKVASMDGLKAPPTGVTFHTKTLPTESACAPSDDISKGPPITSDAAAKKLIVGYLKQQNRPYSAIQMFENLHRRIQKPTIERILQTMSDETSGNPSDGELKCKEYGKAKIFYYNQDKLSDSLMANDMDSVDAQIDTLQAKLDSLQQSQKALKNEVDVLQSQPADDALDSQLKEVESAVAVKRAKFGSMSSKKIDVNALQNAIQLHNKYRTVWSVRKVKCMEMVELISDGMGKSLKHVAMEIGLELDEDANVTMPKTIVEAKK